MRAPTLLALTTLVARTDGSGSLDGFDAGLAAPADAEGVQDVGAADLGAPDAGPPPLFRCAPQFETGNSFDRHPDSSPTRGAVSTYEGMFVVVVLRPVTVQESGSTEAVPTHDTIFHTLTERGRLLETRSGPYPFEEIFGSIEESGHYGVAGIGPSSIRNPTNLGIRTAVITSSISYTSRFHTLSRDEAAIGVVQTATGTMHVISTIDPPHSVNFDPVVRGTFNPRLEVAVHTDNPHAVTEPDGRILLSEVVDGTLHLYRVDVVTEEFEHVEIDVCETSNHDVARQDRQILVTLDCADSVQLIALEANSMSRVWSSDVRLPSGPLGAQIVAREDQILVLTQAIDGPYVYARTFNPDGSPTVLGYAQIEAAVSMPDVLFDFRAAVLGDTWAVLMAGQRTNGVTSNELRRFSSCAN